MLTKIIHAIFGAPSVDTDLFHFKRALARLNKTAEFHDGRKQQHLEAAEDARLAAQFAENEAARARKVAERFNDLMAA